MGQFVFGEELGRCLDAVLLATALGRKRVPPSGYELFACAPAGEDADAVEVGLARGGLDLARVDPAGDVAAFELRDEQAGRQAARERGEDGAVVPDADLAVGLLAAGVEPVNGFVDGETGNERRALGPRIVVAPGVGAFEVDEASAGGGFVARAERDLLAGGPSVGIVEDAVVAFEGAAPARVGLAVAGEVD